MPTKAALWISPFFFPEEISTGKWNSLVVSQLTEDFEVHVICLHPHYPEWKIRRSSEKLVGIEIQRYGRFLKFPKSPVLRRAILELYFFFCVLRVLLSERRRFERIIFVSPPTLAGVLTNFFRCRKRILVVHDIQCILYQGKRGFANSLLHKTLRLLERVVYSQFQSHLFLSDQMRDESERLFGIKLKSSEVAYPFVTIRSFVDRGRLSKVLPDWAKNIVYSGALGDKQDPEKLVRLMDAISRKDDNYQCHVFSRGAEFQKIEIRNRVNNFHCHDLVEESDLAEQLIRSDVQIIPQRAGTSGGAMPSKLPNLIAADCRLLIICDEGSEIGSLLSGIDGIAVSHTWEVEKNIELIEQLLAAPPAQELSDARKNLLKKFSLDAIVEQITA